MPDKEYARVMRAEGEYQANSWLANGWEYLNSFVVERRTQYNERGLKTNVEYQVIYILGLPKASSPLEVDETPDITNLFEEIEPSKTVEKPVSDKPQKVKVLT